MVIVKRRGCQAARGSKVKRGASRGWMSKRLLIQSGSGLKCGFSFVCWMGSMIPTHSQSILAFNQSPCISWRAIALGCVLQIYVETTLIRIIATSRIGVLQQGGDCDLILKKGLTARITVCVTDLLLVLSPWQFLSALSDCRCWSNRSWSRNVGHWRVVREFARHVAWNTARQGAALKFIWYSRWKFVRQGAALKVVWDGGWIFARHVVRKFARLAAWNFVWQGAWIKCGQLAMCRHRAWRWAPHWHDRFHRCHCNWFS